MAKIVSSATTITSTNGFLAEHPQIARMPQNQKEWSGFIQALQRWTQEYEGEITLTATAGWTTTPTFDCFYYRYGKIVVLELPATEATSNSTTLMRMGTLPTHLRPARQQIVPCPGLVDNGTPVTENGQCVVTTTGGLEFGLDNTGGGWTGSGAKGFGDDTGNCIIYSLHDAARIS